MRDNICTKPSFAGRCFGVELSRTLLELAETRHDIHHVFHVKLNLRP